MSDTPDKIKKKIGKDTKRTFFEKITRIIPIYHGYKVKELRREADSVLREHVYNDLNKVYQKLKDIRDKLVENEYEDLWKAIEKTIEICDTVASKVKYADKGYSGFFDALKINEEELDRLYEFDSSLLDDVKVVSSIVSDLENAVHSEGDTSMIKKQIRRVEKILKSFEEKFSKREDFMHKFKD